MGEVIRAAKMEGTSRLPAEYVRDELDMTLVPSLSRAYTSRVAPSSRFDELLVGKPWPAATSACYRESPPIIMVAMVLHYSLTSTGECHPISGRQYLPLSQPYGVLITVLRMR